MFSPLVRLQDGGELAGRRVGETLEPRFVILAHALGLLEGGERHEGDADGAGADLGLLALNLRLKKSGIYVIQKGRDF